VAGGEGGARGEQVMQAGGGGGGVGGMEGGVTVGAGEGREKELCPLKVRLGVGDTGAEKRGKEKNN